MSPSRETPVQSKGLPIFRTFPILHAACSNVWIGDDDVSGVIHGHLHYKDRTTVHRKSEGPALKNKSLMDNVQFLLCYRSVKI